MGMTVGVFYEKLCKKLHESTMFLIEWMVIWQNMDMRAVCFLTKYGMRAMIFSYKLGNKGILLTGWSIIDSSFDWIDVFLTDLVNESKAAGFFIKKLKTMTLEHRVFRDWTFFWQNIGMKATGFSQNGRFFDNPQNQA